MRIQSVCYMCVCYAQFLSKTRRVCMFLCSVCEWILRCELSTVMSLWKRITVRCCHWTLQLHRWMDGPGLWPASVDLLLSLSYFWPGQTKTVRTTKWQNSFKTESKQFWNCLFQPKQPRNVSAFLANHSRYPLFMQNCYLWCFQSNLSQQTWRSYALQVSVVSK